MSGLTGDMGRNCHRPVTCAGLTRPWGENWESEWSTDEGSPPLGHVASCEVEMGGIVLPVFIVKGEVVNLTASNSLTKNPARYEFS